ncbi:36.4 kDa proline-rich protein-like [Triticum urartu]|nr:36.4 kDa proline-rich protein-like [Triticum urartu]XP_048541881.1 36.4 kDa proline-rich protein-like [Triticum urartu]
MAPHWHWDRALSGRPGAMASLARVCSLLLVGVAVVLLLPGTYGWHESNCPPGHGGGGGGGDPGHHHPPHHGKPPKHHHGPPSGHKCPPCHPPPTPRPPPTPPYGPPTPLPPPYVPPTPSPPPYTPPTPPYIPPSPPYVPPTPLPPPYVPPYVPPTPPYTPPYVPPTPPYTPSPPYVPPTPPYVPPPSPGPGRKTCPIDALKLNACVDVLSGLVHLVIGREARSKCCPLVQGVADLDAALCLCTTIRARVLNINIYLPVALRLLITCGKHPPNGFQCPTDLDA